jgi:hypothetical protein
MVQHRIDPHHRAAEGKPFVRKFEPGNFVYRDYPGLKGFIDRTGKIVIKPEFAEVGPFVNGLARAVLDGYSHIATWDDGRRAAHPALAVIDVNRRLDMQSGPGQIGLFPSLIPVILIPFVGIAVWAWVFYKFYGALMAIRDELSDIKDALRERRP